MVSHRTGIQEEPEASLYRRIEGKLEVGHLRSDRDLVALVRRRLPVSAVAALSKRGVTEGEICQLVLPRRTLTHRRNRGEALTRDESDKMVRLARITALAEQVFGSDEKAGRWMRKAKRRFDGETPLAMLATEAGARLVEEMLVQVDEGMAA